MKILVAMSGGVDSSVAAKLLTDAGHECIGCTMKLYENEDIGIPRGHTCCSLDDVEDARQVAYRLKMPYYVFRFSDDFKEKIIGKFVSAYENGITPNPCIDCNRYMKFDRLYERARVLGYDHIATGHYAQIEEKDGVYFLKKAVDPAKDQSYVLYSLAQEQLAHTLFPLGGLCKEQTRELARAGGFLNADKPDSQDICFVPDGNYAAAIERFSGKAAEPGNFVDESGRVLGQHRGIIHYTIGQHKGLGLYSHEKRFVLRIDAVSNTVVLGEEERLFRRNAAVKEINWISGVAPAAPVRCAVKIRYRQKEQPATLTPVGETCAELLFDEPQRAITPGQAAVFYDGDVVLGGGVLTGEGENR